MQINRRGVMGGAAAMLALGSLGPTPVHALTEDQARAHVDKAINDVLTLIRASGSADSKAGELRQIMERTSALPQIARFSAGRAWREMSDDQQNRFTDAFADYIARVYARRFSEYSGQEIKTGRIIDAGKKGLLVQSTVSGAGQEPILVEWLVSDRGGSIAITDIVIEGVSLALTQREEIGSMLSQRGNDVEKLIEALGSA